MPTVHFTKMHGLANDFVVINALDRPFDVKSISIPALANRHIGIGFDQLLIIESSKHADFFCRIYNSDGSQAKQCGNGLRCIARFIHEKKLFPQPSFAIETIAGIYPIFIQDYDHIRVSMGPPTMKEPLISLPFDNQVIPLTILSIGNPHALLKVQDLDGISIDDLGPKIASHPYFPEGVNVGFMQVLDPEHIRLRTFERGAGETFACGSNACAAAVAGIINTWLHNQVHVAFHYGSLFIEWEGDGKPLYMTGPATQVFEGVILALPTSEHQKRGG